MALVADGEFAASMCWIESEILGGLGALCQRWGARAGEGRLKGALSDLAAGLTDYAVLSGSSRAAQGTRGYSARRGPIAGSGRGARNRGGGDRRRRASGGAQKGQRQGFDLMRRHDQPGFAAALLDDDKSQLVYSFNIHAAEGGMIDGNVEAVWSVFRD